MIVQNPPQITHTATDVIVCVTVTGAGPNVDGKLTVMGTKYAPKSIRRFPTGEVVVCFSVPIDAAGPGVLDIGDGVRYETIAVRL